MIFTPQKPENALPCWRAVEEHKHTCVCGYSKKNRDLGCQYCAKIDPMGEAQQAVIADSWARRWGSE